MMHAHFRLIESLHAFIDTIIFWQQDLRLFLETLSTDHLTSAS